MVAVFSFTIASTVSAGGRFGNTLCQSGDGYFPCSRFRPVKKPNPEKEIQAFTMAALHIMFAEEEKKYGSGFTAYLIDTKGGPYVVALANARMLRQKIAAANPKDLEYFMFSLNNKDKPAFMKSTGLQDWIVAFSPPKIISFSPESGIVGDEITIKGENFGTTQKVKFLSAVGPVTIISDNELRVKVPNYIGGIRFPIEVITQFGSVKSAIQFTQLTGDCDDKNISRAFWELLEQRARGAGRTGQCDPASYGNYETYEKLLPIMQQRYGFKKRQPPKITSVSPDSGPAGTKVYINGDNLYQLKAVLLPLGFRQPF